MGRNDWIKDEKYVDNWIEIILEKERHRIFIYNHKKT